MARNILVLLGSPRKRGNTSTVVEWLKQGASDAGARVEVVDASRLKYAANGCTACMGCQRSKKYECVLKDKASRILASFPKMAAVVFATPVYFVGPSAQLKLIVDRMFSLFKFDAKGNFLHPMKKTRFALVATAGGGLNDGPKLVQQMFEKIAEFSGKKLESLLVPNTGEPDETAKNAKLRAKAIALGKKLARG